MCSCAVKMPHLLSATCQDATSFGRQEMFRQEMFTRVHVYVCMYVSCAVKIIKLVFVLVLILIAFVSTNILGAVHRYYESRRRLFNDSQPQRREKATQVKRTSQKRKLQQRVR